MSDQLPPEHEELLRRVDEVLHYVWDPIGVAGAPEARDEYDSYAPRVFAMLIDGAPSSEIPQFLVAMETEAMGLSSSGARLKSSQFWNDGVISFVSGLRSSSCYMSANRNQRGA